MIVLGIFAFLAIFLLGWSWANAIDNMNEKHPDYKGEDLFDDEDKNSIS